MKLRELFEEYRDKSQTYFRFTYKGEGPFRPDKNKSFDNVVIRRPSNAKILKKFGKLGIMAPNKLVELIGGRGKFWFTSYGYKKIKRVMQHYQVIKRRIPDSMIIYRDKFQIIAIDPGEQEWFKSKGWPDIKDKEFKRKVNAIGNEQKREMDELLDKEIKRLKSKEGNWDPSFWEEFE